MIYDIALIFSFEILYKEGDISSVCEVISLKEETTYNNKYIVKIVEKGKTQNTKLILYTSKNHNFVPGDILNFKGEFIKPEKSRNYKGFNYSNYLRQSKIYGIIHVNNIAKVFIKKDKYYFRGKALNIAIQNMSKIYESSQEGFLEGILLGYTEKIEDSLKENFRNVSVSHILAISGLHVSYIIFAITFILEKIVKNKNLQNYTLIFILIIFWFITGESISCMRACIMQIIFIISFLFKRKYNFYRSFIFSFFIILILNPYNIFNIGMWLSYLGILGIKLFYNYIYIISKHLTKSYKISSLILQILVMSISVQIMIFPIIIYNFNTVTYLFFLSNIAVFLFIDKIIILGYLSLFFSFINLNLGLYFSSINKVLINIFLEIIEFFNRFLLSKVYVKTPNLSMIFIYFFVLLNIYIFSIRKKHYMLRLFCSITFIKIQIKWLYLKFKKVLYLLIIITVIVSTLQIKKNFNYLNIYFIDVGQGDCTLLKTPKGQNILIDGGEGNSEKYDYGKNVVLPYLLDRKITKLDYIIISHFDSDHVGGVISIMKEIKVNNVIIGKQFEVSENFNYFYKVVKDKKISVQIVEAEEKIYIEKDLYFHVLWPASEKIIRENVLNNNSLVCKLIYKDFSILFTGDIEETAEKAILGKYENNINILKADVLKIAHHGSKTSSTIEFLEKVNSQYALIGVGKNNTFGHPSGITLEKLEKLKCIVFRTDENGEITIRTNGKKIRINKYIK